MDNGDKLQQIRQKIDALDLQLQALINQRATAAQEVAAIKLEEERDAFFYRPER